VRPSIRHVEFARSHHGVLVSELAFVVFLRPPSPRAFALGSSSRALAFLYRVSRVTARPPPPGAEHLPWGFLPHRDTTSGVHSRGAWLSPCATSRASQARFVPSLTFLTSSTASSSADVAGLFRPAATSGLWLFRVFSSDEAVRARRPPLPSCRFCLPPAPGFTHGLQRQSSASRALLPIRVRCEPWWFRP